ncbi:unnamed protein product [Symbiodinium sp. CCMP2592]|nr:unnamed protein product [Symbiodinium sp. CCMP2592]
MRSRLLKKSCAVAKEELQPEEQVDAQESQDDLKEELAWKEEEAEEEVPQAGFADLRYRQTETEDHSYETVELFHNNQRTFLENEEAREAASSLPPPSRVLRRYITQMFSKDWKQDMLQRGIDPKRVLPEAIQELANKLCLQALG